MNNFVEKFINKARIKHNDKFDYSKVNYVNSKTKVEIICPEHGSFYQTPQEHLKGYGCPLCSNKGRGRNKRWTTEDFIEKAKEVHGSKYDYSKVKYINANTKVEIICPEHGSFWQLPSAHISRGQGCPKCAEPTKNIGTEGWIERFKEKWGNEYDYSKFIYKGNLVKSIIICPKHGEFEKSPSKHLEQGCPKCSQENKKLSQDFIIERFNKIHNGKYEYKKVIYKDEVTKIPIICPIHGEFLQSPINHYQGCGCPKCGNNISKPELEISDFIKSMGFETTQRERDILNGKEIDIYIPSKKIAIEYNGLRWHSEEFGKDRNYHLDKLKKCEEKGIRLIHIFEDEWIEHSDIVKSILSNALGTINIKIPARKCEVREVSNKECKTFLDSNHIQGACSSSVRLGLYYNDELVSVMTFGKPRKFIGNKNSKEDTYELIRFCNKLNTTVTGGASKLFKYFIKTYIPIKVITYADKRWSQGNLYKTLGFTYIHDSTPNYFYIKGNKRENRFLYRKSELVKKYNCPPIMSEHEFCLSQGWYRIYDCGNMCFEYVSNTIR